jgi:hypothetical protein
MTFITEIEKFTLKFTWKHKRLWIPKATLQKEQCWGYHNTWLQNILQSHGAKTDMKTSGTERGPRYESTQLCPHYFWQRHQKQ